MELKDLIDEYLEKSAAPKEKLNRKKMLKALEKAKAKHQACREMVSGLEHQKAITDAKLDQGKQDLNASKEEVKKLHSGLQRMDLANADDVVFYANDMSFIIDGKEYHLDEEEGEYKFVPMGKWRRDKKQENEVADASDSADHTDNPLTQKDDVDDPEQLIDFLNSLD